MGEEISDAAERMRNLNVQPGDLAREVPRLEQELANMRGGLPALAAQNAAIEAVAPLPHADARKGGVVNQIKSIQLSALHERLQFLYKPCNAMLVLAGAIETESALKLVGEAFGRIERGQAPVIPITAPVAAAAKTSQVLDVKPVVPNAQSHAALAIRAPEPSSADYPAFLILAARLARNAPALKAPANAYPVNYAVLDNPHVLLLSLPVAAGEDPAAVLKRLKEFARATCAGELKRGDADAALNQFGFPLNLRPLPDRVLAGNIYGVSLSLGYLRLKNLSGERLAGKLKAVTGVELAAVRDQYFADAAIATAVARVTR